MVPSLLSNRFLHREGMQRGFGQVYPVQFYTIVSNEFEMKVRQLGKRLTRHTVPNLARQYPRLG
jgi:hypothetical protein